MTVVSTLEGVGEGGSMYKCMYVVFVVQHVPSSGVMLTR